MYWNTAWPQKRRPRDSQRSKVYSAENDLYGDMTLPAPMTVPECQVYVNKVLDRKRVIKRFGKRRSTVVNTPGRSSYVYGGSSTLHMTKHHRQYPMAVLHELAHALSPAGAMHNHEFAANYLFLVREVLGVEMAEKLKAQFKANRVRFAPKRTRNITDEQRAALRERLVAARAARAAKRAAA